jgi:acetyl esterase/lipase
MQDAGGDMSEVSVRNDVVFGSGGGRDLLCDVYSPADPAEARPAVLLVHGGGWRRGDKSVMEGFGRRLAAEGFVGVASQYRLSDEAPWPAHIEDVKAALRWMRANAAGLGIDASKIAALGRSAGAHLVLLAAGTPGLPDFEGSGGNPGHSTEVAAVVGVFPPTVFFAGENRIHGGTPARALMGEGATAEAASLASPLHHVTPSYPPAMLLHGTADKVVPVTASMVMYEALVKAGVPAEMHLYAEQPHGFAGQPDFIDLCAAETVHFLKRYLLRAAAAGEQEAAGAS